MKCGIRFNRPVVEPFERDGEYVVGTLIVQVKRGTAIIVLEFLCLTL